MKHHRLLHIMMAVGACVPVALGRGVGDPAGELKVGQWIKGAPVVLKDAVGKKVVVVEFWATWCGPCRVGIPHLTEVAKQYKDRGVVLVSISNEEPDKVKAFVEEQGERMGYTVAVDTKEGDATRAFMQAFYISTIPHAFIVDRKGVVAWHGSPMEPGFDRALEAIVSDKYDLEAFKKTDAPRMTELETRDLFQRYFVEMLEGGKSAKEVAPLAERLLTIGAANVDMLNALAWTILDEPRVTDRDLPLALRAIEKANEQTGGKRHEILDTLARALFENGKRKEAVEQQKKAIELCQDPRLKADFQRRLEKYEKTQTDA